jgi:hypothetical protein
MSQYCGSIDQFKQYYFFLKPLFVESNELSLHVSSGHISVRKLWIVKSSSVKIGENIRGEEMHQFKCGQ